MCDQLKKPNSPPRKLLFWLWLFPQFYQLPLFEELLELFELWEALWNWWWFLLALQPPHPSGNIWALGAADEPNFYYFTFWFSLCFKANYFTFILILSSFYYPLCAKLDFVLCFYINDFNAKFGLSVKFFSSKFVMGLVFLPVQNHSMIAVL